MSGAISRQIWLQQFALAGIRIASIGRQFGAGVETRGSLVEVEKVVLVDPFEIEQQRQRAAHADVGKHRTAGVEHQKFRRLRHAGPDGVADHLAAAGGREIIAVVPAQRLVLDAEIVEAALERLELAVGLAIEVEPDLVEIPQAAVDREIAAPIVGIARQRHAGARLHRGDAIGAGADRPGHRGFLEGRGIDGVARQHRHQAEDQRQFAVVGAGEIESHRERIRAPRPWRPWRSTAGGWGGPCRAAGPRRTARRPM